MPSINQIADWQDSVQLGKELVTYGTVAAVLNNIGTIGLPNLEYMPEFIDSGENVGATSERLIDEFAVGKKQAAVTFKTRMDEVKLYLALRGLFQTTGTETGAGPYKYVFNPWTAQPSPNLGTSIIVAAEVGLTSGGVQMLGCLCESIVIESSEGGFVTMDLKWRGTTSTLVTPTAAAGTWKGTYSHTHWNNSVIATGSALNVKPTKMRIEIKNNLKSHYGTSQTPQDLALGNYEVTGSFTVPYKGFGVTHMLNAMDRTPVNIKYSYGPASPAAGAVVLTHDGVFEDAKITEENGLRMVEFPWRGAKNATTTALEVNTSADQVP